MSEEKDDKIKELLDSHFNAPGYPLWRPGGTFSKETPEEKIAKSQFPAPGFPIWGTAKDLKPKKKKHKFLNTLLKLICKHENTDK